MDEELPAIFGEIIELTNTITGEEYTTIQEAGLRWECSDPPELNLEFFRKSFGDNDNLWMMMQNYYPRLDSSTIEWDSGGVRIDETIALINVIHLEHMIRYLLFETSDNRGKISGKGSTNARNQDSFQEAMQFETIGDDWMLKFKGSDYDLNPNDMGYDNLPSAFRDDFRETFAHQWGCVILDWLDGFYPFAMHQDAASECIDAHTGDHSQTVLKIVTEGLKLRHSVTAMSKNLDEDKKLSQVMAELTGLRNSFVEERAKNFLGKSSVSEDDIKEINALYGRFRNDAFTLGLIMALAYYRESQEIYCPYVWRQKSKDLLKYMNEYWRTNLPKIRNLYTLKSLKKGHYPAGDVWEGSEAEAAYWKCGAKGDQIARYPIHRHIFLEILYQMEINDDGYTGKKEKVDKDLLEARTEFFFDALYNSEHGSAQKSDEDRLVASRRDAKRVTRYAFSKEIKKRIDSDIDKILKMKKTALSAEGSIEDDAEAEEAALAEEETLAQEETTDSDSEIL